MRSSSRVVGSIVVCAMSVVSCHRGSAPPLGTGDIAGEDGNGKLVDTHTGRSVPPPLVHGVIPVAVVRANGFGHQGDSAVVLRRHTAWPYNVIVLDDAHLSVPILGGAMSAVSHEVRSGGEVPATDYVIEVHEARIPKSWSSQQEGLQLYLAKWELDTLKRIPLSNVQGIGDVPAILIHLAAPKR